jgi:hypothetical protein
MAYEWPTFLPFLLFPGFFFAAAASTSIAILLAARFIAFATFFTSLAAFFFAASFFFYAISLAFVSLIFNIYLSPSSIASHVSRSTIKYPTIFFDRFFLFAAAVLIKSNSCLLIRAWAALSHLAAISTFFRLGGLPPNQIPIGLGPPGGHPIKISISGPPLLI